MPGPDGSRRRLKRNPLALWFLGLAMLGGVRFHLAFRHDALQAPEPTTWAWLIGSLLLGAIGVSLLLHDMRRRRHPRAADSTETTKN